MDFFESQELARRKTKWLVFYFILALITMIAGIYFVVIMATQISHERMATGSIAPPSWFDPLILAGVAVVVLSIVGCGSLYKIASLRGGGESVAAMLGGRYLPPNSGDPAERRILNVVEEMALAAGTPVPPVYILDNEPGINAFAAGYTVDDAVIGINRGTIEQLSRDELQGVVAHEFSHILNGDMRMSIRMIGILHGIQVLALIGLYVLRGSAYGGRRSSDKGGGGYIILIAIGVVVIGWAGLFFARLIKAALSRQREYLADASAVQFTRNPEGISGALKMIGASMEGSVMQHPQAEEASHMYFGSMFRGGFPWYATHPPLDKRITRLDPRFDGDFERIGFPGVMGDQFPIDPVILVAGIGLPDDDDVEYSEILVDRIPDVLAEAARDVFSARCIVFGVLLDDDPQIRESQLRTIAENEGQPTVDELNRLIPAIGELVPRFRLPVFEILQGTLTAISPEQYQSFRKTVDTMVEADRQVDLFEFFLRHHLIVHLDRRFGLVSPPVVKYRAIDPLKEDICQLLAILVRIGHDNLEEAVGAFDSAVESLGKPWQADDSRMTAGFSYSSLTSALQRLNESSPKIKKRVLTAAAIAITHDGQVTVEEAELFRAMSESLDCPVPPVVASIGESVDKASQAIEDPKPS